MNNIWRVTWYNEDRYGWMEHIVVVLQGKNMDSETAENEAVQYLKFNFPKIDLTRYDHKQIRQQSNEEKILAVHMGLM